MDARSHAPAAGPRGPTKSVSVIARETLRRIATRRLPPTPENYELVWKEVEHDLPTSEEPVGAPPASQTWGELLAQAIRQALVPQLAHLPELQLDAQALANEASTLGSSTPSAADVLSYAARLRQFWTALDAHSTDVHEIHEGLLRILRLLTTNLAELLGEDTWMRGQMEVVTLLADGPLDGVTIAEVEKRLREISFQQGVLKHGIDQAKDAMRAMIATFVDRLSSMASGTAQYHERLEHHARRIERADSLAELSTLVVEVMEDTRGVQVEIGRSQEELQQAQRAVAEHEARTRRLEGELTALSSRLNEDYLTQLLNRRGLARAFQQESTRADRAEEPMCLAILDIDNFKHLNDRLGHAAGDQALVHLSRVLRESIRPSDSIARWGGEEFVILLPETTLEGALKTMVRVQRTLTRRYYLHNHERVLITFSAGVAQRRPGESQDEAIARADRALYKAKAAGRNCVAGDDEAGTPPISLGPASNDEVHAEAANGSVVKAG
jgi:diguanylate cyclase